ncbi:MAG: BrnA antitoxin family protein [Terracidiphilus sp.]
MGRRLTRARMDADVLEWLKAQGRGYPSRSHAILLREVLKAVKAEAK